MRYLWVMMMLVVVIGLDPVTALAGCQTWTVLDKGTTRICTQCCYGAQCTLTCY